jgi:hypothetical protein
MKPKLTRNQTANQINKWVLLLALLAGWFGAVAQRKADTKQTFPSAEKNAALSYELISAANNTWGYDILSNNKLTIHQPTIPGQSGNEGFKTKEAAQKVAELVVEKMKKGEMPPTVTQEEMKKLNVLEMKK